MLIGFASCSQPIADAPQITETQQNGESNDKNNTNNNDNSTNNEKPVSPPSETNKNETEKPTDGSSQKDGYITLAGNSPYKIIYETGYSSQASKLINYLKMFDKTSSYTAKNDSTADSGASEILIGLTNRNASKAAKSAISTYLDFSILVDGNKIAIYANTAERLDAAIDYFASVLTYDKNGLLAYPTSETYVETYNKYGYPNLTIANKPIKDFSIVIPQNATQKEKDAAIALSEWIALNTGFSLTLNSDTSATSANEIIIGKANRDECSIYTADVDAKRFHSAIIKDQKLLLYAGNTGSYDSAIKAFIDNVKSSSGKVSNLNVIEETTSYSGKKAIFIGNSFIYWGGCVTYITNDEANEQIRAKGGDKGYFNEICKANGIDMDVYNYTYGGQNLNWIYTNKLQYMASSFCNDIDYVFISEAGENPSNFKSRVDKIAALFPNAEEIVYLAHENTFASGASNIINALPSLSAKGYKVVAWGALVRDVYTGKVKVPNATQTYNKNSFVKNSSGTLPSNAAVKSISGSGDNFHQNPLSGYITAQMCFSAITGASAIGQKYDFCWDKTIAPQYDLQNFVTCHYNNGQTTNFVEIFNSASDMRGLQVLMDEYMKKYN